MKKFTRTTWKGRGGTFKCLRCHLVLERCGPLGSTQPGVGLGLLISEAPLPSHPRPLLARCGQAGGVWAPSPPHGARGLPAQRTPPGGTHHSVEFYRTHYPRHLIKLLRRHGEKVVCGLESRRMTKTGRKEKEMLTSRCTQGHFILRCDGIITRHF